MIPSIGNKILDRGESEATYGYFAGGSTGSSVANTERIVFSVGVNLSNTISNLSQARSGLAGLSDKTNFGYLKYISKLSINTI